MPHKVTFLLFRQMAGQVRRACAGLRPRVLFSLNDPQWGRNSKPEPRNERRDKKPQRPQPVRPDIEKMWDDFNQRFKRLLRRKGGAPGPGRSGGPSTWMIVVAAFGVGLGVWLGNGTYTVEEGQTGVVSTFGRFSYLTRPGVNWVFPEPVQKVRLVDTSRTISVEIGHRADAGSRLAKESLMLASDDAYVEFRLAIDYRITNPSAWAFSGPDLDATIRAYAESVVRERVGQLSSQQILAGQHASVTAGLQELIQKMLDREQAGITVQGIAVREARAPGEVLAQGNDTTRLRQENATAAAQAKADSLQKVAQAKAQAQASLADAKFASAREIMLAEASSARFNAVLQGYRKAPAVTRDRMYFDALQTVYQRSAKVLVDARNITSVTVQPPLAGSRTTELPVTEGTPPPGGTDPDTSDAATNTENDAVATENSGKDNKNSQEKAGKTRPGSAAVSTGAESGSRSRDPQALRTRETN